MRAALALLTLALSAPALAEEPTFEGTKDDAEELQKPVTTLSVEVGGALATGNAVYYLLNGKAAASHLWSKNALAASLDGNLGSSMVDADGDGLLSDTERAAGMQETTRRVLAAARYDRFFGKKDSLYLLGGALTDRFAGYDLRSHEQVGYSHRFVDSEDGHLVTEIGFDVAQENYVEGIDPNFQSIFAGRLLVEAGYNFNETVGVTDTLEIYENVLDPADLRMLNTASFSAALSTIFSLKLSHSLTFDNVPVEGYRKLDQISMVTLVATIL